MNKIIEILSNYSFPIELVGFSMAIIDVYFPKVTDYLERKFDYANDNLRVEEVPIDSIDNFKYYFKNIVALLFVIADLLIIIVIVYFGKEIGLSETIESIKEYYNEQTTWGKVQHIIFLVVGLISGIIGIVMIHIRHVFLNILSFFDKIAGGKAVAGLGLFIAFLGLIIEYFQYIQK